MLTKNSESIFLRISMLTYMKCTQDFNLVTITVNQIKLKPPSHENTQSYCLLIHDRLVEYYPFNGLVQRVV